MTENLFHNLPSHTSTAFHLWLNEFIKILWSTFLSYVYECERGCSAAMTRRSSFRNTDIGSPLSVISVPDEPLNACAGCRYGRTSCRTPHTRIPGAQMFQGCSLYAPNGARGDISLWMFSDRWDTAQDSSDPYLRWLSSPFSCRVFVVSLQAFRFPRFPQELHRYPPHLDDHLSVHKELHSRLPRCTFERYIDAASIPLLFQMSSDRHDTRIVESPEQKLRTLRPSLLAPVLRPASSFAMVILLLLTLLYSWILSVDPFFNEQRISDEIQM